MFDNEQTLRQLYVANYPAAEKYVMMNNGSSEQAKDVYQEAFIAVWKNLTSGKFMAQHDHSLNNYLLQIVKNKWLDHLRSSQYRNTVPLIDADGQEGLPEKTDEIEDRLKLIKQHFQQLGDVCREVLRRFYFDRQPMGKIASHFKWTEATARNNKYRCIERLRASIQQKLNPIGK